VARTRARRNLDGFLVEKTEGETLLRRPRPSCEVNIKMVPKKKLQVSLV
jgi:hypothetical protein